MLNLTRSNFQAHPLHIVSPSPWLINRPKHGVNYISVRSHSSLYIGTAFLAIYYKHFIVAGAAAVVFGFQTYILIKNNRVSEANDLMYLHNHLAELSLDLNKCVRHMKDIYSQYSTLQSIDGVRVIGHIRNEANVFTGVHLSVDNNLDYISQDVIYGIGKSLARLYKDYIEAIDLRKVLQGIRETEQSIKLLDPNYVEQYHNLFVGVGNVTSDMTLLNQIMRAAHNANSYVLSVYL